MHFSYPTTGYSNCCACVTHQVPCAPLPMDTANSSKCIRLYSSPYSVCLLEQVSQPSISKLPQALKVVWLRENSGVTDLAARTVTSETKKVQMHIVKEYETRALISTQGLSQANTTLQRLRFWQIFLLCNHQLQCPHLFICRQWGMSCSIYIAIIYILTSLIATS